MKKCLLLICLFCSSKIYSQSSFCKVFQVVDWSDPTSIVSTDDSGAIILGTTNVFGAGIMRELLIRINKLGDTLWTKIYGGDDAESATSIRQTRDGGFIYTGDYENVLQHSYKGVTYKAGIFLKKTDEKGALVWEKQYEGAIGECVIETLDKGYVIAGWRYTRDLSIREEAVVIRIDSMGNVLWYNKYGRLEYNRAKNIIPTRDGGFLFCGITVSHNVYDSNIYVVKLNRQGKIIWQHTYGRTKNKKVKPFVKELPNGGYTSVEKKVIGDDTVTEFKEVKYDTVSGHSLDGVNSIQQTDDGGYMLVGASSTPYEPSSIYIIKIDSNGMTQWEKLYRKPYKSVGGISTVALKDGYLILGGASVGQDDGVMLLKINKNGHPQYTTFYPNDLTSNYAAAISIAKDGGYYICGTKRIPKDLSKREYFGDKIFLYKITPEGKLNCR